MADVPTNLTTPTSDELEEMHATYREGGQSHQTAPHVVYPDDSCPHEGCQQRLQAIDFRLQAFGNPVHDPLVRAWWDDTGFAGRCPSCGNWIRFTIREKKAVSAEEASQLPTLPDSWFREAIVL